MASFLSRSDLQILQNDKRVLVFDPLTFSYVEITGLLSLVLKACSERQFDSISEIGAYIVQCNDLTIEENTLNDAVEHLSEAGFLEQS